MLPVRWNPWIVTTIVKFCGADSRRRESCTCSVMGNEPVAVGVPVKLPEEVSNVKPGGNPPVSVHVNGGCPPLATVKLSKYGNPTAPAAGSGVLLITGGVGVLTMIEFEVPVMEAVTVSVALIVWTPSVFSVTGRFAVPFVSVILAGKMASGSVLEKCTVPE